MSYLELAGLTGGPIGFDYGFKTIRFGAALEGVEPAEVVAALVARRPALGDSLGSPPAVPPPPLPT